MSNFIPDGLGPRWIRKSGHHAKEEHLTVTTPLNVLIKLIVSCFLAWPILILLWLSILMVKMLFEMFIQ